MKRILLTMMVFMVLAASASAQRLWERLRVGDGTSGMGERSSCARQLVACYPLGPKGRLPMQERDARMRMVFWAMPIMRRKAITHTILQRIDPGLCCCHLFQ